MKTSRYNVHIPYKGKIIVYNTLWNSFAMFNKDSLAVDILNHNETKSLSSNIIHTLLEKKILVEDSLNEWEYICKTFKNTAYDNETIGIFVLPTLGCNFRCWYCYENHDADKGRMSDKDISNIIKFIDKSFWTNENFKKVNLRFFGGEPFLYYNEVVEPLLKEMSALSAKKGIEYYSSATSNASLLSKERISFLAKHNMNFMQITLDGNRERHNRIRFSSPGENSYDVIVQNIKDLLQADIRVSLRFNISEHTHLNVGEMLDGFSDVTKRNLLNFSIHKVWQANSSVNEIISQIVEEIRKRGYQCSSYYSSPSSIRNICYADKSNEIVVKPGGKIYKCTARDFSDTQSEGILTNEGDIVWNQKHQERNALSILENKSCMNCKIFPICAGGCKQKHLELKDRNSCVYHMTEEDKVKYALMVLSEKIEQSV